MHQHKHSYNEAERRQWQEPEPILQKIGLKPGMVFMDIGCGDGFFALPAARIAGPDGAVHGVDANAESLYDLRLKAEKEGLTNITLVISNAEEYRLCQGCADIVFFGNCLHDFNEPDKVLANAKSIIKPGGIIADLDWKKKPTTRGPPQEIRFDEQKATALFTDAGLKVESITDSGQDHYLLIARSG